MFKILSVTRFKDHKAAIFDTENAHRKPPVILYNQTRRPITKKGILRRVSIVSIYKIRK
jgi:hypothetical protein